MFSILRNQNAKSKRRRRREQELTEPMIADLADRSPVSRDEIQTQLRQALDRLDDEQKLPLLLVSMEGLSVDEAAEALDLPRGTVLSRLHRGRKRLKEIMTRQMGRETDWKLPSQP